MIKKSLPFIVFFLIISVSFYAFSPVFAETVKELEQRIEASQKRLSQLEAEAKRIQKELEKTGSAKASLQRELNLINKERKSIENTIKKTEAKIDLLDSEIEKKEKHIKKQNEIIEKQMSFLETLFRKINQKESFSLLESFLQIGSLSDFFLDRDRYLQLQTPILKKTNELRKNKVVLFEDKKDLEQKQKSLQQEQEKLKDQKKIILDTEHKKQTLFKQTKNKESEYQKNLRRTQEIIKGLDKEIRSFESKLKFILNKKALPPKGSEVMDWPLDKVLITQRFGRTTASGRLYLSGSHSGMDFRAAIGTPVYAVADGIVKGIGNTDDACPGTSFGKWVFIEHDGLGLSTTYGHLSRFKVKPGQRVKKGQLIAYSGNTGHTTGPHLHLTVYATKGVNGEQGVRITNRRSNSCVGKSYYMPLAPTAAYLDPIDYLPHATLNMFKHPSLAK